MIQVLVLTLILALSFSTGCAYKFGMSDKSLPGGYTQVAIPVFKNTTAEVGVEPLFTNALIRKFARSQVARVSDKDSSPLLLVGTVIEMRIERGPPSELGGALPTDAVLSTDYRIYARLNLTLKRKSDEKIIWEGQFNNEKSYYGPRLVTAVVNSANATYNQSVKMQKISELAEDMMTEAHDRMTENF